MSTYKEYREATKYENLPVSPQKKGDPRPAVERPYDEKLTCISLPDPKAVSLGDIDLISLLEKRVTHRKYAETPLSLEELSFLLWATQGVKEVNEQKGFTWRIVPSAGARHPFETYLLVNAVEGVRSGLYRYIAVEHKLVLINDSEDINEQITEACLKQKQVRTSAVTFCWVADIQRTAWRYSERAYRYILLDAGHVCQNLYLAAEAINCGVCAIAAYDDDLIDQALGVDGDELFTAYIASLGKKP